MTVEQVDYGTFEASLERSRKLEEDLKENPGKYRILTGDRPTGRLHVGHYFGSLQNRVRLNRMGVPTFIVIADYQVLTDRETFEAISENVHQLTIDYLAAGLDPSNGHTFIFPHSHVPELNLTASAVFDPGNHGRTGPQPNGQGRDCRCRPEKHQRLHVHLPSPSSGGHPLLQG